MADNDLQALDIQISILDPKDPEAVLQLIEWAKQVSARMKVLQNQINKLNDWVYPK
jgi:hypothetical protein